MDSKQEKQHDLVLTALRKVGKSRFGQADAEPVKFDTASWNTYLSTAGRKPIGSILRAIPDALARQTITRRDVISLAHAATTKSGREALLVGTLVWGKGPRNNRMFPSFVRLLSDPRLDSALVASATHAREGRPAEAYSAWRRSGVSGLGEAFFTKWLWAASHTGGETFSPERPRCLILDVRVWNTLGHADHRWSSVVAAGTNRRAQRYEAYTRACALWSKHLSVSAEQVEWALFSANGSLKKMAATTITTTHS
jgi:hypothetical protein